MSVSNLNGLKVVLCALAKSVIFIKKCFISLEHCEVDNISATGKAGVFSNGLFITIEYKNMFFWLPMFRTRLDVASKYNTFCCDARSISSWSMAYK